MEQQTAYTQFVEHNGPDSLLIRGDVPPVTEGREPFEELWMPIKKRFVKEHSAPIFMNTARSDGITTLNFIADGRIKQPENVMSSAIDEMRLASDQLIKEYRQATS